MHRKAHIALPKIYLSHGKWRFVPAVGAPTAFENNKAAISFIGRLNRKRYQKP